MGRPVQLFVQHHVMIRLTFATHSSSAGSNYASTGYVHVHRVFHCPPHLFAFLYLGFRTMSRLEPEREIAHQSLRISSWIARINSRLLEKYKGQTVRLTVKVLSISADQATVEASDGGQVSRLPLDPVHLHWHLPNPLSLSCLGAAHANN